jgi:phospholipid/cholesterol/gamma-HCH transport system permease protein
MSKSKSKAEEPYYSINIIENKILLRILKPLSLYNAHKYDNLLDKHEDFKSCNEFCLDLTGFNDYDTYLVIFINNIKKYCSDNNLLFSMLGASSDIEKFLKVLSPNFIETKQKAKSNFFISYFTKIGETSIMITRDSRMFIEFLGEIILSILNLLIKPKQMRWKDFPFNFTRAGVSAVPITFLILFLIGIITGYQGALQLEQFGADIYIADLIGISIVRELAPLMTAILVAGRSGSAFAAEIGTMKVSEEIDAMMSMGFDPIKFLVLPRVLAVTLAMPLLVILTDLAGIAGGLLAAVGTLDITVAGYVNELQRALSYGDLFTGLGKSMIFGFLVATVGCFRGLQVRGGAESVGRYTTIAVVSGVLSIIVADAVFTFIFQSIGI